MGKKCHNPDCGWDGNEPDWEFCGHCGADLEESSAPAMVSSSPVVSSIPKKVVEIRESKYAGPEQFSAPLVHPTKVKLVVINVGRVGQEFPIAGDSVSIGRWDADGGAFPEIDLTQDDPENYVSRKHARIFVSKGQYHIEDLGSSNGTFVNKGPRLVPGVSHELKNGDEIVIGKTFLSINA